ncbi:MAG: hypothetical protein IPO11_13990 [Betaproteobacteria bacterium]|nr:hypothetical protein [Betaproteobacteria bacterium]
MVPAWDGQWFKRAFLTTASRWAPQANAEARIDLIAQAWSVLSGRRTAGCAAAAMASVETHLVDPAAGLTSCWTRRSACGAERAGYIQAYPPGVRENGGQYSARRRLGADGAGPAGCTAGRPLARPPCYRHFHFWLSPAHRASHPTRRRLRPGALCRWRVTSAASPPTWGAAAGAGTPGPRPGCTAPPSNRSSACARAHAICASCLACPRTGSRPS